MEDRILTQHPEGKSGVNISKKKYEAIKNSITECLSSREHVTFKELTREVNQNLAGSFDGSISWYVTTVKLDLEARGIIERIPRTSPQYLRLVEK